MKYVINCPVCGSYEIAGDMAPCFCMKCGADLIEVSPVKTKARVHAEERMKSMDELRQRVVEARDTWFRLAAEYEDGLQLLRVYRNRGILTTEEIEPYSMKESSRKTLSGAIREYRAKRRGETG